MFIPAAGKDTSSFLWQDFVLVLPAISIGGVGQLAIDLLLYNIPDTERVGYFHENCFVPVVGPDPFETEKRPARTICTSCEVFQSQSKKLVIIQQRSPFIKGRIPAFRRQLVQWIEKFNFKHTIIVGSCSSHIQDDVDLTVPTQQIMFLASNKDNLLEEVLIEKLSWTVFSHKKPSLGAEDLKSEIFIPGGGIVKTLYEDCCKNGLSSIALLVFSSDGNATTDAVTVVNGFDRLLPFISSKESFSPGSWKFPDSWSRLQNLTAIPKIY
ncbi:proteasome assembly chaperone 2-like [Rhopilema esculentum]|uniref:proteasome assembly chaperone 2-like n=1 Tax=Rhopilema esculentum TaxID=499914 RepID=UPI0031D8354D